MRFFYWSVYKDPRKDASMELPLETVGFLFLLRRRAALEDSATGELLFDGSGRLLDKVASFLGVTDAEFKKHMKVLKSKGEAFVNKDGLVQLTKWETEQREYFAKRERERERQAKKRAAAKKLSQG